MGSRFGRLETGYGVCEEAAGEPASPEVHGLGAHPADFLDLICLGDISPVEPVRGRTAVMVRHVTTRTAVSCCRHFQSEYAQGWLVRVGCVAGARMTV